MKKVLSLCLVAAMIFGLGSCTKEAPNQGGQNPFYVPGGGEPTGGGGEPEPTDPLENVGAVPADFTRKVIIEEATGEWCGYCPDGAVELEKIIVANPNTAIGVAVHAPSNPSGSEAFYVKPYWVHFDALVGISGFPGGSVNRNAGEGRGAWAGTFATESVKPATCGMAIETSVEGTELNMDIFVGYNTAITAASKITVMVIEDNVPESAVGIQSGAPDGYIHQHVLRGLITDVAGDDITLTESNKYTKFSVSNFDLNSLAYSIDKMSEASIIVFVHSADGKTILNAQKVHIGETKKWN